MVKLALVTDMYCTYRPVYIHFICNELLSVESTIVNRDYKDAGAALCVNCRMNRFALIATAPNWHRPNCSTVVCR